MQSFFESAAVSGLLVPLLIQCPAVSNPPPSTPPPYPLPTPPHPSPSHLQSLHLTSVYLSLFSGEPSLPFLLQSQRVASV